MDKYNKELRKHRVTQEYLEAIAVAVEQALAIEDPKARRTYLRATLLYWMSIMYEEGGIEVADLSTSLSVQRGIIEKLRQENQALLKRISLLR